MRKHILFLLAVLAFNGLTAQSPQNKAWSIDYHTWNTNGRPTLYINCGNNEAFNTGAEITMELWVRAYTFAENRKIMGKMMKDEPFNDGYVLGFENLHVYAEYFNPGLQTVPRPGDGPIEPDSSLVHIASTYSSHTGKIKSYVNGMLAGETTMFPANPIVANSNPFIIGNAPWDMLSYQFYGEMDEVRVWNKALSQEEIQTSMHIELQGNEEALVAYYNFNQAHDSIVPDKGSLHLDGTLSNASHESTTWAISHAPVASRTMAQMQTVQAAWYHPQENYYKMMNEKGMSAICDIAVKEYEKYAVMGHNALSGLSESNQPVTNPTDFQRSAREWYINCSQHIQANLVFNIEEGEMHGLSANSELKQYALLHRASLDEPYKAIAHPSNHLSNILIFSNINLKDGFYALGHSSAYFELENIGITEDIFPQLSIAPNPIKDRLIVEYAPKYSSISILSLEGKLMMSKQVESSHFDIDLSALAAGVYLFTIESHGHLLSKKIIKQ